MTYQQHYRSHNVEAYKTYQAAYRAHAKRNEAVKKAKDQYYKDYYQANRERLNKYRRELKRKQNDKKRK